MEAGTPLASPDNPLLGVSISLDTRVMTELAIEMESATGAIRKPKSGELPQGFDARSLGRHVYRSTLATPAVD